MRLSVRPWGGPSMPGFTGHQAKKVGFSRGAGTESQAAQKRPPSWLRAEHLGLTPFRSGPQGLKKKDNFPDPAPSPVSHSSSVSG